MQAQNTAPESVDIIFAGGGTAACVAAGRLAKANPDLKILLVEGGRNNFQDPTIVNPVGGCTFSFVLLRDRAHGGIGGWNQALE